MKRSNTALMVSLVIHVLAALIFTQIYRQAVNRRGVRSIDVLFDVEVPEPKLRKQVVEIEQPDMDSQRRTVDRRTARVVRIDKEMDKTTAYRDVAVTDDSTEIMGIETHADVPSDGSFTLTIISQS